MKNQSEPIIFFGSGPVAAASLRSLSESFAIAAVITKPVPPHHHGEAPVAKLAEELGITTYFARDKSELLQLFEKEQSIAHTRLGILVDFGVIIPQEIIDTFSLGIINSHFSLLPELRGADPITFSILSGQHETGVSLMLLVEAMDEGPILGQSHYELPTDITTPQLTDRLIEISNGMLDFIVPQYLEGKVSPAPQDPMIVPSYSRKLTKGDGQIDWHKSAPQIEREIRAFYEWPKSHATINDLSVIITDSHVIDLSGPVGTVKEIDKQLVIYCGQQALIVDRVKPAGKKEMSGSDFLLGHPVTR